MTAAPRRVIHLASAREWRGGQRQVLLLARCLAERGVDQVVITARGSELARRLAAGVLPVIAVSWRRAHSLAALGAAVREARRAPSILHAHDPHSLALAAFASSLSRRTPVVVTRRVDFHLRRPRLWARADRVIAISSAVRNVLIQDGVPSARIEVVHSGIDVDVTSRIEAGNVRRQLGLPTDRPLAVNVAALVGHKDQATLLRAAASVQPHHPELQWAVAGTGPLRARLEAMAEDLGVRCVVHFLGHLDDPLPLIAAADLFVMSSSEEGLGTTVLDAMALGRPIVATAAGGIPEMLGRGAGLLAPPGDSLALASHVLRLLDHPGLAADLGRRALAEARAWTAGGMADEVLRVYRSMDIGR